MNLKEMLQATVSPDQAGLRAALKFLEEASEQSKSKSTPSKWAESFLRMFRIWLLSKYIRFNWVLDMVLILLNHFD